MKDASSGLVVSGVGHLVADSRNPALLYATTGGGLVVTADGAMTWTRKPGPPAIFDLTVDAFSSSVLYGLGTAGVFKSVDGGDHWSPSGSGLPNDPFNSIAADSRLPGVVYLVGLHDGGVFRSQDGAGTWTKLGLDLSPYSGSVSVDPTAAGVVYVASPMGVFRSSELGTNWQRLGGIPSADRIVVDPSDGNRLYAITDVGILRSTDRGETWSNTGLPSNAWISPLAVAANGTVYAGTSGFGVFSFEPLPDRPELQQVKPRATARQVGGRFLTAPVASCNPVRFRGEFDLKLPSLDERREPRRLRPGGTIGVAAVSGPVDEEKLARGLASLRGKGYGIREASNLHFRRGFLAGTDEERARGYRELLRDPGVDAIFFARGGYGSSRILEHLDGEEMRTNAKIHLGGSDLTALFAFVQRHAGVATFYGPMVAVEMAEDGADLDWEAILRGDPPSPHAIAAENVLTPGRAEGVLIGGCLSLLASLCGTPEAVHGEGAILFWEDTGEETYRLDRMLTQLERSGAFDGLRGMVIGSVVPRRDGESAQAVRNWLRERFAGAPFPAAMGLASGHLESPRTIPLGARARLDLDERLQLSFPGPVVQ